MIKQHYIGILVALFALLPTTLRAEEPTPYEGYRTRLIAYPTATDAHNRGLERQRYMQPITEWEQTDEGTLKGKFTFPFSWLERQVFLRVEGAEQPYEVYINGKLANECMSIRSLGHIALQSEGGPIEFRNIYLTKVE